MLATVGGAPLPDAAFTMSVEGAGFTVSDNQLSADAGQSGEGTLTVTFGSTASCTANLVNLGDAPAAGSVRVYVFDDITNAPVAGATVVIDTDGDGVDDGGGAITDDLGIAFSGDLAGATTYSATVFAGGYNYLSIAGLSVADNGDVTMPLSARSVDPDKGGFTGIMDFVNYEDRYLGGRSAAVKAGVVAGSLPLKSLLNFNTDLLIGEITDADCSLEPTPAGCYRVEIRGLVDETLALPGGAVVGLAAQPIKEHFDSVAVPGRRYAWSLGTEVEIADLSGVINVVTPYLSDCSCDQTEDSCDEADGGAGDCSCDLDCGLNIDIGGLYDDIVPLVNNFATGLKGNLPIESATASDWTSHVTGEYATRSSDERYPKLDNGTSEYGQLVLREAWSDFAAIVAPALPADPFVEGQ
jgi:hypothetical protein